MSCYHTLNESRFCKIIRENNAKESDRKLQTEAKSLLSIQDNDLFIWDNYSSHMVYYNLNNLNSETDKSGRFQILQCTDAPKYTVDGLVWNNLHLHVALWGQLGITVMELPQKWGKFAEFQGGKDTVSSKCVRVAEHYFLGHRGVKLLQVHWHPASVTDSHIVFLTSDNLVRSIRERRAKSKPPDNPDNTKPITVAPAERAARLSKNDVIDLPDQQASSMAVSLPDSDVIDLPDQQASSMAVSLPDGDVIDLPDQQASLMAVSLPDGDVIDLPDQQASTMAVSDLPPDKTTNDSLTLLSKNDVIDLPDQQASTMAVSDLPPDKTTNDSLTFIYDIMDPEHAVQTIYLGDNMEPQFSLSMTRPSTSSALGDNVVAFDFGQSVDVSTKQHVSNRGHQNSIPVWPLYCLRGNGDVMVAYSDLTNRCGKLPVQGPLLMHPPAEDNYGTDACSILYLSTTPPVLVLATCDGRLHHCILMPRDLDETLQKQDTGPYCLAGDQMLYVYETLELELSLTTPTLSDSPTPEDIFTCPIKIVKDVSSRERYHCTHSAGVHTVALPWIHNYQAFCCQDEDILPEHQDSIVEHLICTKPLVSSPPAPILGLAVYRDTSLGSVIITLSSNYEFYCIRLSDSRPIISQSSLMSSSRSQSIPSPLRKISREPFDDRIQQLLRRTTSNPLLKSKSTTELSQQECYQLLSRATQVFREEYIQKHDLARQEIQRRVKILKEQKLQQENDLQSQEETRNILTDSAEHLANMCEECKENQEELVKRIETVMRKLQSRVPFLSEAERNMKKELETMEDKLDIYRRNLEQLRVKKDYQQRQIQQSFKTQQPSPVIKQNQNMQLRQVLKQEGDEISQLVNSVKALKMDSGV